MIVHRSVAAERLLEQAEEQERIAAKFEARAASEEYEAQRAVERGNRARATGQGARRAAARLRREAELLEGQVTYL